MKKFNLLFILGTRPEAIKLCPLIRQMRSVDHFQVRVCVTAQHREMLDQVLQVFGVVPDYDLGAMRHGQTLFQSTARIIAGLEEVLNAERPAMVLVQGDTTTTFCGALAAFYARTPVGHVEAGLRTGNIYSPFPEEMNRILTTRLASLHFAATELAKSNLVAEGVDEQFVEVTGNTGVDAVLQVAEQIREGTIRPERQWDQKDPNRKLILVTAHRRESFGPGFERICAALSELARRPDVELVYPVHPNPQISEPARRWLSSQAHIHLIDPLDYVSFVDLMRRSYLLLTDSGGVQEEGPSLGRPVLVMRPVTERPEAVEAGTAELVGDDAQRIVAAVSRLLEDEPEYARRCRIHNPYGDGHASERIASCIGAFLQK